VRPVAEQQAPGIEYIGGLVLQAGSPRELAQWYAEKLDLPLQEIDGGFYAGLASPAGPVHFGIVSRRADVPHGADVSFTFRVRGFDAFLAARRRAGLVPTREMRDAGGRFAVFRDPEGHELGVWGD
jgi:predicted enzyme related to lactoylglutathione lyase